MSNYEMLIAIFAGITLVIQIVKLSNENKKITLVYFGKFEGYFKLRKSKDNPYAVVFFFLHLNYTIKMLKLRHGN